ncbi:MAG: hypothetical protein U0236_02990 [Nitrospira sp.]
MIEVFLSVLILLVFWLLRVDHTVVLLLALGLAVMNGCTASITKDELELTTHDPAQDHQKIAAYYRHEAAKLRQASEETSVRITVYERLFGPTSDWVAGTRLLAQSYEDAATELERKAREHTELTHGARSPSDVQPGFH